MTPLPVKRPQDLGPKQLQWCREHISSFDDAERRARQAREETERMKKEAA